MIEILDDPDHFVFMNEKGTNKTEANFSWYAEAEPKLEALRAGFANGGLSEEGLMQQLLPLCGLGLLDRLWVVVVGKKHGTPAIEAFEKYQADNPMVVRLLGTGAPDILHAFIVNDAKARK